jgi:hypothetical protein
MVCLLSLRLTNFVWFADVIFALRWVHRELRAFGGDAKRITLFGNSAGAEVIQLLYVSPAVPRKYFKQAFISSGEPYFAENLNAVPSGEILNEFGCLYDRFNANRTLSDEEKVKCLRKVPANDLLDAQKWYEDERGLIFTGPETDTELLPAKHFSELLPNWTPRPTVFSVTLNEFENRGENMTEECITKTAVFGYDTEAALDACVAKYGNITDEDEYLPVSSESMHAEAFVQAYTNSLKGASSYLISFDLANHSAHANDLTFFFRLHPVEGEMTPEEVLMDKYYPKMVKDFVRSGYPAKDWKPLSKNGTNYYVLDFKVSDNGTLMEVPHLVEDYYDPEALKFWLHDMAKINKKAKANETDEPREGPVWRPTVGTWPFPLDSDFEYAWPRHRAPYIRPLLGSLLIARPPEDDEYTYDYDTLPSDGLPIHEVWSAFWLVLSLAVLLTAIILLMVATRLMYRYKNARGYSYNHDEGFFTERSKIVNVTNGARYT